jgi:RNA polymerase sigma-70 factor (ECF subfamily)
VLPAIGTKGKLQIEALPVRMLALEEAAFQDFADYFGPQFRALFVRSGLPPMEAEDLAVNCIGDIAVSVNKYRRVEGKSFASWVFAIAKNAMADWRKDAYKRIAVGQELVHAPPVTGGPEDQFPRQEVVSAVQEALHTLTAVEQEVVFLRDLGEERSYAEIGAILGIPEGTARVRHKRALDRLRSILEDDSRILPIIAAYDRRAQGLGPCD